MKRLLYLTVLAVPVVAAADEVRLNRDDVIPVIMQTELNFKTTHEGDHFKAEVADSRMLPLGSRLEGVVDRVERKRGDKPGFMDIEFTSIILPDGHRASFHGTPIALSKDYVTRDKYGRWEAKKGVTKETVVLGATAGGLIIGSIIGNKPFEGAMVGALLGILGAETDKDHIGDGSIVIPKGSKVGARVDEDLTLTFDGRWDNYGSNDHNGDYDREGYNRDGYDRYGYDRQGRYNPRYDDSKNGGGYDDPDRERYNSAGYDKYGYDRDGHYNERYDTTRSSRDRYNDDYRGGDLRIEIDRTTLKYSGDERPYKAGWVVMVPLEATADQLGYRCDRDRNDGYRLQNENDELTFEQGSRSYSLNGRRGTLPAEVEVRNGVTFVPIDAFTKLAKGSVYVNGTKYRPQA